MENPKFLYLKLNENNAQVDFSSRESFAVRTASGRTIGQIKYPRTQQVFTHIEAGLIAKPDWAMQHALNAVCTFDSEMLRITQDDRLTDNGKRERVLPVFEKAVKTLSSVDGEMRKYVADVKNWRFQHYAVPQFDPSDIMGFLREQEVRSWINALGDKAPAKLKGPLLEGSNPYVSLAILRSPIPYEHLRSDAEAGWRVVRDKADPATAQKIAGATELIDWAEPFIKVTAGMVRRNSLEAYSDRRPILDPQKFESLIPAGDSAARELFNLQQNRQAA